jgi:hypothetical protein
MVASLGYVVRFGAVAWTIEYEDAMRRCVVTFDPDIDSLDSSNGPQVIFLNPGVRCSGGDAGAQSVDAAQAALVLERVQSYLEGVGYAVKRWHG